MIRSIPEDKRNGLLSDDDIISLIKKVNKCALDRRSEIALERNTDPLQGPVKREHWQVVLVQEGGIPLIAENPSIYVQKKYYPIEYAREIIAAVMISLCITRRENDKMNADSIATDKARVNAGLAPLREFKGHLVTVASFDQLVVTELAAAYATITGEPPTMGGYKNSGDHLVSFAGNDRNQTSDRRSPFATFLIDLIELYQLRRLNGANYSYGVLRAAMEGHWRGDGSPDEELDGHHHKASEVPP